MQMGASQISGWQGWQVELSQQHNQAKPPAVDNLVVLGNICIFCLAFTLDLGMQGAIAVSSGACASDIEAVQSVDRWIHVQLLAMRLIFFNHTSSLCLDLSLSISLS